MIPRSAIYLALIANVTFLPTYGYSASQSQIDLSNKREVEKHFQIASADAENALEAFSELIDRPLVYLLEQVEGIRLNAAYGKMLPSEAIRKMVANTSLMLVEDDESDTWVIKRKPEHPTSETDSGSLQSENPKSQDSMTTITTKRKSVFSRLMSGLGALLLAGASTAVAQDDMEDDEDIFTMSPFVIDVSNDTGYTAQSTLAGTRIASSVRELGSSITILTEKFLEDTGATDALELLPYTGNTEVGGALGNFSAGQDGAGRFTTEGSRRNPQNGNRIRGLSRAELTRDYFATTIPFDGYNTSRVTLNRGPNSVLFGIGSPGGVIDHSLNKANINQDRNQVKIRLDHRGSYRGTVDFNRTLIEDRLAVRVNAMYDERVYKQEPATEEDQRLYAAFEGVLFKNEKSDFLGQTRVRGHIEVGDIYRIPVDVIPPIDAFRFWFDGYTDIDSLLAVPGIDVGNLDRNLLTSDQASNGRFIPQVTHNNITGVGRNNTKTRIASFINIPLYYESGSATVPGWSDPALAGLSGGMSRMRWPGSSGRPRQDFYFSGNAIRDLVGFTGYSLQNREIFDYHNHLFQGTLNTVETAFDVQQFTIDQSLWGGRAGVELSYNRQRSDQEERFPLSSGLDKELYIDISEFLSNDVPNPNLGRPVVRINHFDWDTVDREQETIRATAFVDVDTRDFSENLGKWLGRHTLTFLYEQRENDLKELRRKFAWESDEVNVRTNESFGSGIQSGRRSVTGLIYVGPSVLGANSFNDVRITDQINISYPTAGERHTAFYWDHTARERKVAEFYPIEVVNELNQLERIELESQAFALKSTFLNDHLVTVLAWRKDREKAFEGLTPTGEFTGELPERNFDGTINNDIIRLQDDPSSDVEDETLTTSIVGFFPEKYLFELPFGMDLSFHYYEAESFQPEGFAQNIIGEPISAPTGETTEYGFTLELLERRLSLRFNWYETAIANNRTSVRGTLNNSTGRIGDWLRNFKGAQDQGIPFSELGADAAASSYEEILDVIMNLIPEPTKSLVNYQFDGPNGQLTSNEIPGLGSTFDFVSEGLEIELVGSIKPNWSIALNVAQQETVQSNTAPVYGDIVTQIESNIISSGLADVRDAPTVGVDTTFLERYQSVVSFPVRAELSNDGRKSLEQREWRVNLVTNYDFLDGVLKGFAVGGALRWQDEAAIGYPLTLNEGGDQIPDLDNPYLGDDELNGDIWFSYRRPIMDGKVNWRIQLNVRNLIRTDSDIPVVVNPNGELTVVRIPPEQQVFITNTFTF